MGLCACQTSPSPCFKLHGFNCLLVGSTPFWAETSLACKAIIGSAPGMKVHCGIMSDTLSMLMQMYMYLCKKHKTFSIDLVHRKHFSHVTQSSTLKKILINLLHRPSYEDTNTSTKTEDYLNLIQVTQFIHVYEGRLICRKSITVNNQCNLQRWPGLCGSSLDFEFIRECTRINKICPKIFHFLTKIEVNMTHLVFLLP